MLIQLFAVAGPVVGALVGGITTYAAGARRAKTDLAIADRHINTQLEAAQQQAQATVKAETEKHRREKFEEAYRQLMMWIDDLEQTIDDVWAGIYSEEDEFRAKIKHVLDEWPWETLRPPKSAAATQHYWSDEIRELRRKFAGRSADFYDNALAALRHAPIQAPHDEETAKLVKSTWHSRTDLLSILNDVRKQANQDVLM